jgi:deoxyribodipyrimidine photo-lyase
VKTIIVWFRSELRINDHPALAAAINEADYVVPVFILDSNLLQGSKSSSNRNRFLYECLEDLKSKLQSLGGDLVIRTGDSKTILIQLAREVSANTIYFTADYTPYATSRDISIKHACQAQKIEFRGFPGRLVVSSINKLQTKSGTYHKVFTPFWKQWMDVRRREVASKPKHVKLPPKLNPGGLPQLNKLLVKDNLSKNVVKGGETEARKRLEQFLKQDIKNYHQKNNDMAADDTSRLSPYLHFGCISPLEIETMLNDDKGSKAWQRQLAWREFYNYIIFNFPHPKQEFQERYRKLKWDTDQRLLAAWENGLTGYPLVDAGMRQLKLEGWMHNRARLVVGCFLTKDLWIDWRLGENYFMKWLLDGDMANNNGNWQWIASVGVDPAPVFRRLYNPASQQRNNDPSGSYVRKYVPELRTVPDKFLAEPWLMPPEAQAEAGCIIGKDYPGPLIDHKQARLHTLEQFRNI